MYVKDKDNADWMWKEICFYIPKKLGPTDNPPKPIDKDVTIKKSKERVVFVKKFGGYAMEDSVWIKHADAFGRELKEALKDTGVGIGPEFYAASYDKLWKMSNRTNEVMFEKIEDEAV